MKHCSPQTIHEELKFDSLRGSLTKLKKRKRISSGSNSHINDLEEKSIDSFDMIDEEDLEEEGPDV